MIEHASRRCGSAERLSVVLDPLVEVLAESNHCAGRNARDVIGPADVEQALAARFRTLSAPTRQNVEREMAADSTRIVVALARDATAEQALCAALRCPLLLLRAPAARDAATGARAPAAR